MSDFELTKQEKAALLMIARKTIEQWLEHNNLYHVDPLSCSENQKLNCGAFVTLHKNKQLRGCIGRFITNDPLFHDTANGSFSCISRSSLSAGNQQ